MHIICFFDPTKNFLPTATWSQVQAQIHVQVGLQKIRTSTSTSTSTTMVWNVTTKDCNKQTNTRQAKQHL